MGGEPHWLLAGELGWLQALAFVAAGACLVVMLGAADVARALARDVARGCTLLFGKQLRVGDYVELGGFEGIVEAVGLRAVRIRDDEGAVHFVRTGAIDSVTNRSFGRSWAVLDVPTSEADLDRAVECLRAAAAELRGQRYNTLRVLDELQVAGVERGDAGAVRIRARIRVAPGQHASVRRELLAAYHRHLSMATVA